MIGTVRDVVIAGAVSTQEAEVAVAVLHELARARGAHRRRVAEIERGCTPAMQLDGRMQWFVADLLDVGECR